MSAPEPESLPVIPKRRSGLPILLGFLVVLVGGGLTLAYLLTRPDPFKVLVAVDVDGPWWKGGAASEEISEEIADGLEKIGFEVVRTNDSAAISVLSSASSPVEAAKKLRAGFVVHGVTTPEVIEHPVEQGFVEVRAKVTLTVSYVGSGGSDAEDVFTTWAGGPTKKDAMKILGEQIANRAFDASLPRITGHAIVKERLDAGEIQAVVRLDAARRFSASRDKQLEEANAAYDKLLRERREHKGPLPITYLGDFRGLWYLAGTGASGALVNTQGRRPFYHPKRTDLEWLTELETVAWHDGSGTPTVLWSGYHVLGYPAAAPDGAAVLFVEDLFGHAKTLTVVEGSKEPRRVIVHEQARFDNPEVAPGGRAAAMFVRLCYACKRDFAVISLLDGNTLFRRESAGEIDEGFGGYGWAGASRAIYLYHPGGVAESGEPLPEELRVVDVSQSPAKDDRLVALEKERCGGLSASADGKRVVLGCSAETGEYRLVLFDTASGARTNTSAAGLSPSLSPDGSRIAYTRDGDVFVYTVDTAKETRLTDDPFYERRALFSADGRRVYFESQAEDPTFKGRTAGVVAWVDVP